VNRKPLSPERRGRTLTRSQAPQRVNSGEPGVGIAHMCGPAGWVEPGQTLDFDEYTLVLRGTLWFEYRGGMLDVYAGQAVLVRRGEWVLVADPQALYAGAALDDRGLARRQPAHRPDTVRGVDRPHGPAGVNWRPASRGESLSNSENRALSLEGACARRPDTRGRCDRSPKDRRFSRGA
jgi:mannose-6-phosphate isomerase-like protein (cupin superfamily)